MLWVKIIRAFGEYKLLYSDCSVVQCKLQEDKINVVKKKEKRKKKNITEKNLS